MWDANTKFICMTKESQCESTQKKKKKNAMAENFHL